MLTNSYLYVIHDITRVMSFPTHNNSALRLRCILVQGHSGNKAEVGILTRSRRERGPAFLKKILKKSRSSFEVNRHQTEGGR